MSGVGFKEFVLDQLRTLGAEARPMFGGHGLYCGGNFFGILHKGRLYFYTNAATRQPYLKRGMKPFRPNARQTLGKYYEVPAEVVENTDELVAWAQAAAAGRAS
ncbi:MAG: TfoX/Sxy family protein [Verrucomicrobia bacterium]|nr:TfoX/Sxy family protein [Verrucomicrobiota bacterium]